MGALLTPQQIAYAGAERKPTFHVPWRSALMDLAQLYTKAAQQTEHVEPCMLAAIVDRETGARNIFQIGMPHAPGCGVGDCQITADVDWTDPLHPTFTRDGVTYDLLDRQQNLIVAAKYFLEPALVQFPDDHVAAFAAYNLGGGGVQRELQLHEDPDTDTTGRDYGHSVFKEYIDFTAVSLGVDVSWSAWRR